MNNFFRNFIALFGGAALGAMVNGAIIALQPYVLPLPQGIDPNDMESLTSAMMNFKWYILSCLFWPTHWALWPELILPCA